MLDWLNDLFYSCIYLTDNHMTRAPLAKHTDIGRDQTSKHTPIIGLDQTSLLTSQCRLLGQRSPAWNATYFRLSQFSYFRLTQLVQLRWLISIFFLYSFHITTFHFVTSQRDLTFIHVYIYRRPHDSGTTGSCTFIYLLH